MEIIDAGNGASWAEAENAMGGKREFVKGCFGLPALVSGQNSHCFQVETFRCRSLASPLQCSEAIVEGTDEQGPLMSYFIVKV